MVMCRKKEKNVCSLQVVQECCGKCHRVAAAESSVLHVEKAGSYGLANEHGKQMLQDGADGCGYICCSIIFWSWRSCFFEMNMTLESNKVGVALFSL